MLNNQYYKAHTNNTPPTTWTFLYNFPEGLAKAIDATRENHITTFYYILNYHNFSAFKKN